MIERRAGGAEPETAGLHLALHLLANQVEKLFVGIAFVRTNIHREAAAVGHDVVLCTCLDNRHGHLYRPQEITRLRKLIATEPSDVFHCLGDGVDALVAGSMTGLSFGHTIQYHQPLLRYGRTHPGWFAHHRKSDGWQLR